MLRWYSNTICIVLRSDGTRRSKQKYWKTREMQRPTTQPSSMSLTVSPKVLLMHLNPLFIFRVASSQKEKKTEWTRNACRVAYCNWSLPIYQCLCETSGCVFVIFNSSHRVNSYVDSACPSVLQILGRITVDTMNSSLYWHTRLVVFVWCVLIAGTMTMLYRQVYFWYASDVLSTVDFYSLTQLQFFNCHLCKHRHW